MIKNLIFDWGGVLTQGEFGDNFVENLRKLMPGKAIDEVTNAYHKNNEKYLIGHETAQQFFLKVQETLSTEVSPKKMLEVLLHTINYNEDMIKLVKTLKSKYRVFLLSDNFNDVAGILRKRFDEIFEESFYSNDLGVRKPNEQIYTILIDRANILPEESVFIDDKKKNIEGAKAVGMRGIVFQSQEQCEKELKELGVKW